MRTGQPARRAAALALLAAPLLLTGCAGAIHGRWHLAETARNKQFFSIDKAEFRPNGTYTATTTIEGVTHTEDGAYDFNGFTLRMRPVKGGQRSYTANVRGNELQIVAGPKKALLVRGE